MEKLPLVSICCITYNHEKFIAQAIDSFLMQVVDFPVEIVIGDDCSTDSTPKIIEAYRKQHPEKIRVLSRKKNLGSEINFIKTIEACRGEYIALCEGDDYWTDPNKIKLQLDQLVKNTIFTVCVTNHSILNEESKTFTISDNFKELHTPSFPYIIDKNNLFSPFLFQTHTILFRKSAVRKRLYQELKVGDVFLSAELLMNGKGIYLPIDTGVYRLHEGGMFSKKTQLERFKIEFYRSKAMAQYFKSTFPAIQQLHRWNRQKLQRYLKEENQPFMLRLKWIFHVCFDKIVTG